ncbi:MAG: alpha/beta hydrolase [Desulfurococcaceae archaeon]
MRATKRNRLFIVRNLALVLSALSIIALVLYVVPVPEVGEPVTSIALPDSRFVEVDGVLVHYVDHGGGDVLFVLLHGFGASAFTWRELIPELSRMGRVVAFDRPGFGLTERVDPSKLGFNPYHVDGAVRLTCNFVKQVRRNESRLVVIGHSAGGGLALLLPLMCDLNISALVLIAPAWKQLRKQWYEHVLYGTPLADKYGPLLARAMVNRLEEILYRAWYNKSLITPSILEGYKYPLRARNWDKGLYWLMKYREYPDIRDDLSKIKAPVLIIHGVNDEIIPLSSSIELYELLSTHTFTDLVIINECGHLPHEEKPNLVLDVVKRFLKNTVSNG